MPAPHTVAPRTMRDRSFVKNAILDVLSDGNARTPIEIVRAVPGTKMQSLHVTLRRMAEVGEVDIVAPATYRLGTGTVRRSASAQATSDCITSLPPGTDFNRLGTRALTGANGQTFSGAVRDLIARGLVVRVGRGHYRRVGPAREGLPDLSMTGTIRRLMGTEDRPWHYLEVNPHVVARFPHHGPGRKERLRTLYQMHNMAKAGDLSRMAPGSFRLLRPQPPSPAVPAPPKGVMEIAWALSFGGLWLIADLTAETKLTEREVHYALLHMEEVGTVSNPYHLQWRLTEYPTDPVWDSRTLSGAILGVFLRGGVMLGVDVMREIQSKRYIAPMIHNLIHQGLLERVGHGRYRCPDHVRERILPKFAVRPSTPAVQPISQRTLIPRPPSALEARLIDGMARRGEAMRKVEIAAMAGIGRGSAVRAVNALVDKGLLCEPVPGLYRVAA